mgnify:CR=1 FL=1
MELTLYELLGLIKDDKAPKKIRCFGHDYEFSIVDGDIDYIVIDKETGVERYLTDAIGENYLSSIFSTTVEVLEEEKEIEEMPLLANTKVRCEDDFLSRILTNNNKEHNELINKINELVREVNKLKND